MTQILICAGLFCTCLILRQLCVRAHLKAKINMSSCGTWHCWVRDSHTLGETFGKAAVSSLLIIELTPKQLATWSHTHPREMLNWWSQTDRTQKEQVS